MNDSIAQLGVWISKHKYLFVTIAFLVIIVFLDENNMMKHIQNQREIAALESEKAELQEQYDELTSKLEELEADPVLIEKIARERYGMHKADEEIFIFDD
ncbi:MAG: septum formation initiator family protein [Bacteroidaceae bacterium]|nr:septum formation initiator family protein [Bacteroidaceae bacterium]